MNLRIGLVLERILPVTVLAVSVIAVPTMIFAPEGLTRLRGLQAEFVDVEAENDSLRREIEALRGRVERLRDDPTAVEQLARDHLGLVRQSEVVFQFAKGK